jgi:hypothetical protein
MPGCFVSAWPLPVVCEQCANSHEIQYEHEHSQDHQFNSNTNRQNFITLTPISTYGKCCSMYVSAWLNSSRQPWISAKALIPRQFVGCSWACKKSQQASLTSVSCNKFAAGSSTWKHLYKYTRHGPHKNNLYYIMPTQPSLETYFFLICLLDVQYEISPTSLPTALSKITLWQLSLAV